MNKLTPTSEVEAKHTENCFDFLRLFAAFLVLFSHSYPLIGDPEPTILKMTLGEIGVNIFFTTSGFLITQSWLRGPAPKIYMAKRCLRIFPALVVVLLVSVFIVGPSVTALTLEEYFSNKQTYRYLMNIIFAGGGELPGVFKDNPFVGSVNGSLWTLKYEFAMYVVIMVSGVLSGKNSSYFNNIIKFLLFFSALISIILGGMLPELSIGSSLKEDLIALGVSELTLRFPLLATFFLVGAAFSNKQFGLRSDWIAMCGIGAGAILFSNYPLGMVFLWTFIAYGSLNFGVSSFRFFRAFGKFGDFSYGVYIYAFLAQQLVSKYLMPEISWLLAFILSTFITFICAWLSWTYIESPFLRMKNKLTATLNRSI